MYRQMKDVKLAVIGLGYVGLPLLVEFAKQFACIGFDIQQKRITELKSGKDNTNELTTDELLAAKDVVYTCDSSTLKEANVFIVTVPTPIDKQKRPDLTPLEKASVTVGRALSKGDVVIYESTVY